MKNVRGNLFFISAYIDGIVVVAFLFIVVCLRIICFSDSLGFFPFHSLILSHNNTQLKHLITARHVERDVVRDMCGRCRGREGANKRERRKLIINGSLFMATKNLPYITTAAVTTRATVKHGRRQQIKKEISMDRKLIIIIMLCASVINYSTQYMLAQVIKIIFIQHFLH